MYKSILTALFILGFLLFGFFKGISLSQLINFQSIIIVFGGLFLVIWFGFPLEQVRACYRNVARSLKNRFDDGYEASLLKEVLFLARVYRTHGPLALEKATARISHDFLRYGAILVAEGYDTISLLSALEREHNILDKRAMAQVKLLKTLAHLSPALGMAGTVVSLMQVMQTLGHNENMGASLGLALSSTLYGILLANLFFLPISLKLQQYFERESSVRMMLADALIGVQQAEHPLRIAEKLNSYELYCKVREEERKKVQLVKLDNPKLKEAAS